MGERTFWVENGDLRLEGALREGGAAFSAVVLHPHPQYGGDMDHHVVTSIAETLAELGGTVLRFNFRGVGQSDGAYDEGRGEAEDARAAVVAARALVPDTPFVLAGYSFGAMIAAGIAASAASDALILVSPPLAYGPVPALPDIPTLAVTGARDSVAPAALVGELTGPKLRIVIVPDADHGWWPGVSELAIEVRRFAEAPVLGR